MTDGSGICYSYVWDQVYKVARLKTYRVVWMLPSDLCENEQDCAVMGRSGTVAEVGSLGRARHFFGSEMRVHAFPESLSGLAKVTCVCKSVPGKCCLWRPVCISGGISFGSDKHCFSASATSCMWLFEDSAHWQMKLCSVQLLCFNACCAQRGSDRRTGPTCASSPHSPDFKLQGVLCWHVHPHSPWACRARLDHPSVCSCLSCFSLFYHVLSYISHTGTCLCILK